ncbi:hypothetical protein FPV16_20505 [Methylobacterium sp. W2]|uniref:hypothetical protein n=1 Tax=Methylobacterium sp. W2 TaxID=2598107 RepID=UPI001D0BFE0A|nr:hypothetical protein [Methylobacterium sp. W2]MCC0808558.1 hypothetical protein [Methylobacterium sp. W2]
MIPHSIQPKLIKLLPLLGSENDGEVVSTVRAIGRTLASAGTDFHDLTDSLVRAKVVNKPLSSAEGFNYADTYREAAFDGRDDTHPRSPSRRFGLTVWHPEQVIPWWEVAKHCITESKALPRKVGGKFLRPDEFVLLKRIEAHEFWPTNQDASWLETIVARLHQARDFTKRERAKP